MRILWWLMACTGWAFGAWTVYRTVLIMRLLADSVVKLQGATDGWKETLTALEESREREMSLVKTLVEVRTGLQSIADNAATRDAVRRIMARAAKS